MSFEPWQWALLLLGALVVGLSKTGIAGLGILFVAIFANLMPARQATGVVLPMLILGDVVAVLLYRRHTQWSHLWRLFPWTAAGVVFGWLVLGRIDDSQMARLIGAVLVGMLALHWLRKRRGDADDAALAKAPVWFAPTCGVLAGFTTLTANAAGPIMILYLLAMRLPKLEFLGTGAVFFMLLNWFKVPFMVQLELINTASLGLNLLLAPAVLAGAALGRLIIGRINQRVFETTALVLTAAASVKLLVF